MPHEDFERFETWRQQGMAGEMQYLTDRRGDMRADPRQLLPDAQSIVCVGKLYNTPYPYSSEFQEPQRGWISRYAWGAADYHDVVRQGLRRLAEKIAQICDEPFSWKICVDTAPLLERSYARAAGLGWIGKNTCLINQQQGSWFFLGELLLSLPLAPDIPPPDRCGTCTRCIDACPTAAIVPAATPGPAWTIDSRRCISYFTIELRGPIPEEERAGIGGNVFGCDICQDVCPWNTRHGDTSASEDPLPLERFAALTEEEFRDRFRGTAVKRTRYSGFLRNVAVAMGNLGLERFREPLEKLAESEDPLVAEHARWGLERLG